MNLAQIGEQRVEAFPKGKGLCPFCQTTVIARCGRRRRAHWAHAGTHNHDSWKEHETQWHLAWKAKFPLEWREKILMADSGEKHIADVRAPHGLVVEFQHSHLDPDEQDAREAFYKNMVWVVDATVGRAAARFQKAMPSLKKIGTGPYFEVNDAKKQLPGNWLDRKVQVLFDFSGLAEAEPPSDPIKSHLWMLYPKHANGQVVIVPILREVFVAQVLQGPQPVARPVALPVAQTVLRPNSIRLSPAEWSALARFLGTGRPYRSGFRQRRRF